MPLRQSNQSPDCRNVIARGLDLLEKRRGQQRLNVNCLGSPITGMHAYYRGVTRLLVASAGDSAYLFDPQTFELEKIKEGLEPEALVQFETCANYMVAFDGRTLPWKFDGQTITDLQNAPSDGYLACLYKEKLFTVSKADPSTLLWSDSFHPETWVPENYWAVGAGDGDVITAIKVYGKQNHLAVFKQRAVYALYGTSLEDFQMSASRSDHGAVGPNAVVESTSGMMYYISSDGIYAYDGYSATKISKALPLTWDLVTQQHLYKACAWEWDGLLHFALPVNESDHNNLVLCFDPDTAAWWPFDGINASCFALWEAVQGEGAVPVTGCSVDGYIVKQDTGVLDFEEPIKAYWTSDLLDLGQADFRKKMIRMITTAYPNYDPVSRLFVIFGIDPEGRSQATPGASGDLFDMHELSPGYTSGYLRRRFDFAPGSYCHYMQARIEHEAHDKLMKIRNIVFHFKVQDKGV